MTYYPDEGEIYQAGEKKERKNSDTLIFFVHFFGGHKKALRRHIEFVNELGYDAYAFNLRDELNEHYYVPYSEVSEKFGLKHAMADQIEEHLDLITGYKSVIVFAFSNMAGCAIEAMARRDISPFKALICDSGPGASFVQSSYRFLGEQFKVKFVPLRLLATPLFILSWSKAAHKDIPEDLKKFPNGFPVLSIRGWKDVLIKTSDIDQIFEPCKNINWTKLSLPEAQHLTGLKDYPNEYRSGVEDFLKNLSAD